VPNTRHTDPQTSHEAAKSVSRLADSYRIILDLFASFGPMNDEQLIKLWKSHSNKPASDSGIRSRRSELAAHGKVIDTGERVKMSSGRASIVWGIA
jgi:hypothetical protein